MLVYILLGSKGCWQDSEKTVVGIYKTRKEAELHKSIDDELIIKELK